MWETLCVGAFGGLGALLRYSLVVLFAKGQLISFHSLLANVIGSFCMGLFSYLFIDSHYLQTALLVGFCGGLTTFSSFIFETTMHLRRKEIFLSLAYLVATVVVSLIFWFFGVFLGRGL